jgi:UrcA family protein
VDGQPKEIAMLSFHKINLRVIALLAVPTLLVAESDMAVARVDEAPSVTVRYHDLNLDSRDGIATLYGRIHAAAADVCRSVEGPKLVSRVFWTEWHACIDHAVAAAVHAVRNESLSAYHWERIRGWKLRSAATPKTAATH